MKAIILAAGRGSRMRELTEDTPKGLVKLHGRPLLEWQLNALREAGIEEIALVTGYKAEMLGAYGLKNFHNPNWATTNMVYSLGMAESWLYDSNCIVSYSDIFYESDAPASLIQSTAALAITYAPDWLEIWQERFDDPLEDAETFQLNPKCELIEIGNKPKSIEEVEGQYMGLLRATPGGWREIQSLRSGLSESEKAQMHMTHALQGVVERGNLSVQAIPYRGKWGEVDSQEDLELYENALLAE